MRIILIISLILLKITKQIKKNDSLNFKDRLKKKTQKQKNKFFKAAKKRAITRQNTINYVINQIEEIIEIRRNLNNSQYFKINY